MKRILVILLLVFTGDIAFAQSPKDSLINSLPMVDGKLTYTDSINVKVKDKATLEAAAKKWFFSYFKYYDVCTVPKDSSTVVYDKGIFEFKCKPGLVSVLFLGVLTMRINCKDNNYSYKIDNIYFKPENGVLNAIGYERDPNYLIALYKKKHMGFMTSMRVDRGMIRNYIASINNAVQNCIASLNKAMAN